MAERDTLSFGCFNLLADGLSFGEFMCEGGDELSTCWAARKDRLSNVLTNMLDECLVVATFENDHFFNLLLDLNGRFSVGGVWGTDTSAVSMARKLKLRSQEKTVTYEEECQHFGETMASMHGDRCSDKYQSNDGIGIYFRADKVEVVEVGLPGKPAGAVTTVDNGDTKVVTNMGCALTVTFRLKGRDPEKLFTVYGAHLKSGEEWAKEQVRCDQLTTILDDARLHPNPVVLMDSNNSPHYEAKYQQENATTVKQEDGAGEGNESKQASVCTVSQVMREYGYVDAVGPPFQVEGNECFKMRHGRGGQPSKHFQFMFDAIDKILVPGGAATILPVEYDRDRFGFQRYDPALRDALLHLRTSDEERCAFEASCRGSETIGATTCAVQAFGREHMLAGLYPNPRAPSDHPPVFCRVQF